MEGHNETTNTQPAGVLRPDIPFNFVFGYNDRYQDVFRRKLLQNMLNHKNIYFGRAYDHYAKGAYKDSLNDYILGLIVLYYKDFSDFMGRFEEVVQIIYRSIGDDRCCSDIMFLMEQYAKFKANGIHVISSQTEAEYLVLRTINLICRIAVFYLYFPLLEEVVVYIDPISHLRVQNARPFTFGNQAPVLCDAILMIADALSILKNKI